ncbi:ectoine/hydroxyectoine ABC transporter substrate-binding protein EhuB [Propionibacteriaceae bacterium Y2011]
MSSTRRNFLRGSIGAGGLLLAPALLGACQQTEPGTGEPQGGGEGEEAGGLLAQLQEAGSVRIGFAGEEPYGFEEGGQPTGSSPAVVGYIFEQLGVPEMEATVAEFGSLIPALNADRFDVVAAGMSILPERCQNATFSEPVYVGSTAIMVKEGNPMNITDLESVAAAGDFTLGVMTGAVEREFAIAAGVAEGSIQTVSTQQDGLDQIKADRLDGFCLTSASLNWLADKNEGVEVTDSFVPVVDGEEQAGAGGAVFRQANQDLVTAFNEELKKLHEDQAKFLELISPFGFDETAVPPADLTTADLCAAG